MPSHMQWFCADLPLTHRLSCFSSPGQGEKLDMLDLPLSPVMHMGKCVASPEQSKKDHASASQSEKLEMLSLLHSPWRAPLIRDTAEISEAKVVHSRCSADPDLPRSELSHQFEDRTGSFKCGTPMSASKAGPARGGSGGGALLANIDRRVLETPPSTPNFATRRDSTPVSSRWDGSRKGLQRSPNASLAASRCSSRSPSPMRERSTSKSARPPSRSPCIGVTRTVPSRSSSRDSGRGEDSPRHLGLVGQDRCTKRIMALRGELNSLQEKRQAMRRQMMAYVVEQNACLG